MEILEFRSQGGQELACGSKAIVSMCKLCVHNINIFSNCEIYLQKDNIRPTSCYSSLVARAASLLLLANNVENIDRGQSGNAQV